MGTARSPQDWGVGGAHLRAERGIVTRAPSPRRGSGVALLQPSDVEDAGRRVVEEQFDGALGADQPDAEAVAGETDGEVDRR